MIERSKKLLFLSLGHFFIVLGVIGIFLPIMPTTPFAIMAAFCYSRGSKKFHSWLLNTKYMGPLIRDWEAYGVIRPTAKKMSTLGIFTFFGSTLYFVEVSTVIKVSVFAIGIAVLIFIWSRPEDYPSDKC